MGVQVSLRSSPFSLIKRQFVLTHTIRQAKIAAFLGIWVADTPVVKMLCPKKKTLVNVL